MRDIWDAFDSAWGNRPPPGDHAPVGAADPDNGDDASDAPASTPFSDSAVEAPREEDSDVIVEFHDEHATQDEYTIQGEMSMMEIQETPGDVENPNVENPSASAHADPSPATMDAPEIPQPPLLPQPPSLEPCASGSVGPGAPDKSPKFGESVDEMAQKRARINAIRCRVFGNKILFIISHCHFDYCYYSVS